ncbi:MAG: sugar phosphate isomerase/epimerase [Paenibacillaceae bacterium]
MIQVGINLFLWTDCPSDIKHKFLVEQIKQWGFDSVEFPVTSMNIEDCRSFSTQCNELNLARTALVILGSETADPASPDVKFRNEALEQIKRAVDKTEAIGAELLSGPIFQGLGKFTGQSPTSDEWKRSAEIIRQSAEYASSANVKLALEPLNRFEMYMVNTIEQGVRFIQEVGMDNVGLLLDTHHANIEENHVADSFRAYAQYIYHIHISENHRGTPGSGHAIPNDLFKAFEEMNYTGNLTIEAFSHMVPDIVPMLHLWRRWTENEEVIARKGLEFVRSQMS